MEVASYTGNQAKFFSSLALDMSDAKLDIFYKLSSKERLELIDSITTLFNNTLDSNVHVVDNRVVKSWERPRFHWKFPDTHTHTSEPSKELHNGL